MDAEEQFLELERENSRLRSSKGGITAALIVFIVLFLLAIGYVGLSEWDQPLFGKWPRIQQEYEVMTTKMDSLRIMRAVVDSVESVNNILVENSDKQEGVFFEVQIGAFEHFNLEQYKTQLAQLRHESVNQLDKYTLGRFRNYKMAQAFKKDIEKMGIQGSFIVGKINGQRVEITEAVKASKKGIYR